MIHFVELIQFSIWIAQRTRQAHSALRFVRLVSASPSFKPVQLAHLNQ